MKTIKECLLHIEREEKTIDKIARFLKTKKGQILVNKLNTASLKELSDRYKLPKFIRFYKNDRKDKNIIKAVIKKYEICMTVPIRVEPVKTEYKRVPLYLTKEERCKIIALKPSGKLDKNTKIEAYAAYKLAKYIRLHPAPTESQLNQDLFPNELIAGYNQHIEYQKQHIHNFVTSMYNKIPVYGRFKIKEGVYEKRLIAEIKDVDMGGHNINNIPKTHKLLKKAQQIVDDYYNKDSSLVCIVIKGHNPNLGRILIPHKIMLSKASAA